MIPHPSTPPLEDVLELLCTVEPPPVPVAIAIRVSTAVELQVLPLDEDDPLGGAGGLAVEGDVDAVVLAIPASAHRSASSPGTSFEPMGTLFHLAGRHGECHTRWVGVDGTVEALVAEPDVDGGQLHQRTRAILFPPDRT